MTLHFNRRRYFQSRNQSNYLLLKINSLLSMDLRASQVLSIYRWRCIKKPFYSTRGLKFPINFSTPVKQVYNVSDTLIQFKNWIWNLKCACRHLTLGLLRVLLLERQLRFKLLFAKQSHYAQLTLVSPFSFKTSSTYPMLENSRVSFHRVWKVFFTALRLAFDATTVCCKIIPTSLHVKRSQKQPNLGTLCDQIGLFLTE